jgi:phosphoglycerate dehydrogenase-like enzyme
MNQNPRVTVADVVDEEFAQRWQEDLGEMPIDLRLIRDSTEASLKEAVEGTHILITKKRPVDEALLNLTGRQLKLVTKLSHWPIDVDVKACEKRGVKVKMLRQLGCIAVAEHAMTLILACARKLIPAHAGVVGGNYRSLGLIPAITSERSFAFKWLPVKVFELYGKTLGIIGFGEIGKELAIRAAAFEMKILYNDIYTPFSKEFEQMFGAKHCKSLKELLAASDFISIHVPHTDKTDKLFGKDEFSAMKSTAYLINAARGGEIDEKALVWALKNGEIAGAGLDVFAEEPIPYNHPLLKLENVVFSPHIGGGAGTGRSVLAKELKQIIKGTLRFGDLTENT